MTMEITQRARVAAVTLALGVACVAATVLGPLPGEDRFENALESGGDYDALHDLADVVTILGDAPVALATVVLIALAVWRYRGARLAVAVCLASLMAPATRLPEGVLGSDSPSGHSAYVAAVYGFLVVLALDEGRRGLAALAAVPIVAMPLALILVDSHSPSECLAGLLLGAGWLFAVLATVVRR